MAAFLLVAFYAAMALSAYVVELLFAVLHLTPAGHLAAPGAMHRNNAPRPTSSC